MKIDTYICCRKCGRRLGYVSGKHYYIYAGFRQHGSEYECEKCPSDAKASEAHADYRRGKQC